jgi:hypothetical protein
VDWGQNLKHHGFLSLLPCHHRTFHHHLHH